MADGNIGCIEQIARFSRVPVARTAELIAWALGGRKPAALAKMDSAP